jgi:hypothetical protein
MSRRAPSWLAMTPGEVYTLHFWPPYGDPDVQLAKHYTSMGGGRRASTTPDRPHARPWRTADPGPAQGRGHLGRR